jgi:hypothetical protein
MGAVFRSRSTYMLNTDELDRSAKSADRLASGIDGVDGAYQAVARAVVNERGGTPDPLEALALANARAVAFLLREHAATCRAVVEGMESQAAGIRPTETAAELGHTGTSRGPSPGRHTGDPSFDDEPESDDELERLTRPDPEGAA